MSRKLYYSSCSIAAPHIGVTIDDILTSKKANDDIYWCFCHCALTSCFKNLYGYSSVCSLCHLMYNRYKLKYGKDLHIIPIDKAHMNHQNHDWDFDNAEQIKGIIYRGVYIGMSILSLYYSCTRDLDLKNLQKLKDFSLPLISEICDFVDYLYDLFEQIKPDEIITYNGRLFENRMFYDIAKVLGIKYTALEVVGGYVEPYKKVSFHGGLPHSVKLNTQKINALWEKSPLSDEKKTQIASSFYSRRRGGELVADIAVYTKNMKEGVLPNDFDRSKRNIAIFNSSQDEMAALGGEWETGDVFDSQLDAIEFILRSCPNFHFYLRIHPNLKGVDHKDHLDLYKFSKYSNLTIIPPESEVSSYALMEACEKVVTFGSTMGIETTFWGKPSILLGRALYENLDACYRAKSKEEILYLLEGKIGAKDKIGALKYAYFELDRLYGVDKNIIDIDVRDRKIRWNFQFASYLKLFGSQKLYQIAYFYYYILLPKFSKKRHVFPW